MSRLPIASASQQWCCSNGCGECKPRDSTFEYYREEDVDGNLVESRTQPISVSHCCRADLLLWDESKQDFVEWEYPTPPAPTIEA